MPGGSNSMPRRQPLPLPRKCLVVRIGASNEPSINLFRSLGFKISKKVEVFDEVEMRLQLSGHTVNADTMGPHWREGLAQEVVFDR